MIHIAVLLKPYLDLILQRKKTVECRLTKDARDPFENIEAGERIYFKLSAGPYAATAIADHVMFESGLTSKRVAEIRRDYNDDIRGEPEYWTWKRDARYCTLIWLRDVMAIDNGPQIRPLQGIAWLCLEEEPAWRKIEGRRITRPNGDRKTGMTGESFSIPVTQGNVRNNTLYVRSAIEHFPKSAIGGRTRADAAQPITLMLHDGPVVQTDIVGQRNMLRTRIWGRWFRKHGVQAGDQVIFTPTADHTYMVGLARCGPRPHVS